jgi:ABC-type Fe3+ transport system permease subunit/DNA-binding beta-propeller fold protein YncE
MSVPPIRATFPRHIPTLFVAAIAALCCGLPVAWMICTIAANTAAVVELAGDRFRWMLLARTVGFNAIAAVIATLLAAPVAIVLGRGRGAVVGLLWTLVPASLLIPSIVYSYGWAQLLSLTGVNLEPAAIADIARCIFSLAAWLWAVPAGLIGLALRRLDASVQQQAVLDGALGRVTLRQLWPAVAASLAVVLVLAMQEFAVYEQTGISVIATEVRTVFDTGGVIASLGPIVAAPGGVTSTGFASPDQPARAAAAIITGAPLVLAVAILSGLALWMLARTTTDGDVDYGPIPQILHPSRRCIVAAVIVLLVVLAVPVGALAASHSGPRSLGFVLAEYQPQLIGTLVVALVTAIFAAVVALLGCVRRPRIALALAVVSFLVGGQFLAIALIRIYNRPWLSWVYNGMPIVVIAYLARFGWLALLAARGTTGPAYRPLRDMAAIDGASPWQAATRVIWPIAWPTLLASALLIGVLASGEVPATTLLSPLRPPMLVPSLMTWVHTAHNDPMIEASLLLTTVATALGVVVAGLVWMGRWRMKEPEARSQKPEGKRCRSLSSFWLLASGFWLLSASSCSPAPSPDAIWLETGVGPAQVVYPRGIAYAPADDTFFIVDRRARVQHIDAAGQFLNDWMMPDQRYGRPVGISVGPDGNVYVPDTHYHRVIVYSPKGQELRRWGTEGTGPGQFIWPTDVAFDARGRVFVSEYGDHDRIQVFDHKGKFLYQFGSFGQADGQFSRPQSMVIDGQHLYVTDSCNHRIAVFTIDGQFLRNMGTVGSAPGQFRFPYGLDLDRNGRLLVTEFGNNRVQWIDKSTGKALRTWGHPGRDPGQLAYPWATVTDSRGRVAILDAGNNRVQVLND